MFVQNLQTQEQLCIDKYKFYAQQAKDPALSSLFERIGQSEQGHYDALGALMTGKIIDLRTADPDADTAAEAPGTQGKGYRGSAADRKHDAFLCTDSITTEKSVATEYNSDLFHFAAPQARGLLNDIQTQEQNHAEQLYQYKAEHGMTS